MGRIEDASQPLSTHVSVYLRGRQAAMAQQLLDEAMKEFDQAVENESMEYPEPK
jgi:hypothetical protein